MTLGTAGGSHRDDIVKKNDHRADRGSSILKKSTLVKPGVQSTRQGKLQLFFRCGDRRGDISSRRLALMVRQVR